MTSAEQPNISNSPSSFETASRASSFNAEPLLYAFEQAWQAGGRPPIETLLARLPADDPAAESNHRHLLEELVKIDLEYRWRAAQTDDENDFPARPLLEDYLHRFPALGPLERLALELIGEEYRVRRIWGDRPEPETYYARFSTHAGLPALLARIDAELSEQAAPSTLQLMATGAAPVPAGAVPDGYEILGELGRGGMGVVYKARQLRLDRLVAIKMIRAGEEAVPTVLARFRTEAAAAARVQHPHVVQVYEVGEKNGQPFCVMEYVNGGSLARCLAGTPLEARAAGRLLETLARAVQSIHDHGILHRDLKPSNILLHFSTPQESTAVTSDSLQSPSCVPKISDFGLAKPVESAGLTQTGAVLGTPSYMAPEQAESRSDAVGPATDVYGLGAILYEMLTGRPPFRGVTMLETLEQVRNHDPLPPRQLQPALPRDLETICLKCLEKAPSKRYVSAAALADDLERFRLNRPIVARAAGRWERGLKWARRRPALATLAAALVLGIAAALVGGLTYTINLRAARQQANRSYRKTLEAVEQMLVRMGAQRIEAIPGTEKAQVDALNDAIHLYQELLDEQEKPDPELYARLSFALSYLGNRQMGLGRPDEAEKRCRRSLELLASLPAELRDTRACQHQSAFTRYVLGDILSAKNQRAEAEQLYREGCELLASRRDEPEAIDLLSHCYSGLGALHNDPAQAKEYHRQAMQLSEELHKKDPDNWDYRIHYGQTLYNLARNSFAARRTEEAEKLFQQCIDLLEPSVARASDPNDGLAASVLAQTILAHCYTGLALLWSNQVQNAKAETFHSKAIALHERLVQLYPHPNHRQELAQSYLNLGATYQLSKQNKKAEEVYRKAIPLLESVVHDLPDDPQYRLTLAKTCANFALIVDSKHGDESLPALQKGREALEPLLSAHPEDSRFANEYGNLCNNQALVLLYRGKGREALPWHDRAAKVLDDAYRRHPNEEPCANRYAVILAARAQTLTALKEHKKAAADWDRVIEVAVPPDREKYRFWRALALLRLDDHRRAVEDIAKILHRPGLTPDGRYNCVCLFSLAIASVEKDPDLSTEQHVQTQDDYAAKALEILTQLRRDGYFRDPAKQKNLDEDEDLKILRARDDFKHWCQKSPAK